LHSKKHRKMLKRKQVHKDWEINTTLWFGV
jgi:hypothetical protein